jgi:hypothetical protein
MSRFRGAAAASSVSPLPLLGKPSPSHNQSRSEHSTDRKPKCFRPRALFNSAVYLHTQILFLMGRREFHCCVWHERPYLSTKTRHPRMLPLPIGSSPKLRTEGLPPISTSNPPFDARETATPCWAYRILCLTFRQGCKRGGRLLSRQAL